MTKSNRYLATILRLAIAIIVIAVPIALITRWSVNKHSTGGIFISLGESSFSDVLYPNETEAIEHTLRIVLLEDDRNDTTKILNEKGKLDFLSYQRYLDSLDGNQKVTINMTGWEKPQTFCANVPVLGTLKTPHRRGNYCIIVVSTNDPEKVGIFSNEKIQNNTEKEKVVSKK